LIILTASSRIVYSTYARRLSMRQHSGIVVLSLLLLLLTVFTVQGIGVSFSYFLPRNGMFSHPVPPLTLRDIGIDIGRYLGVAGSLSLYSMRGMGIRDEGGKPIDTGGPLIGPFLSVLSSAVGKVRVPLQRLELEASGGLFGCYNFDPPLITGTLDRYLATADGSAYEAVSSSVNTGGRWAWGWVFGGKATYFVKGQIGIAVGANYYLGGGKLRLSGSYVAAEPLSSPVTIPDLPANLQKARLDYTGLEIILGVEIEL
jgi:hypothetical protein